MDFIQQQDTKIFCIQMSQCFEGFLKVYHTCNSSLTGRIHNVTPISHYPQDSVDATYALEILVKNTKIINQKLSFFLSNFNVKGKGVQFNVKYFLQTPL